ncbi:MAG: helix-turn-helix domain-containing protein [Propionibacteriaceae bacterium]
MDDKIPREKHTPQSLRAVTHPVRIAILRTLSSVESANVRMIAERVGEPANSVSFHLHQLEKYSYVLRAALPETASKRESWWQLNEQRTTIKLEDLGSATDPHAMDSIISMVHLMYSQRAADIVTALNSARLSTTNPNSDEPEIHVGNLVNAFHLTCTEAEEIADEALALFNRWKDRSHPGDTGTVEYEVCVDLIPHLRPSTRG